MGQQVQCVVSVELDATVNHAKSIKRLTALVRERIGRIAPRASIRVLVDPTAEDLLDLQPPHVGLKMTIHASVRRLVDDRDSWCVPAAGAKTPQVEEDEDADGPILEDVG